MATLAILTSFTFLMACQMPTSSGQKLCATLLSDKNYKGNTFPVYDGEKHMDLKAKGWQVSNSYMVENNCTLNMCNDVDLTGVCLQVSGNLTYLPKFLVDCRSAHCFCQGTEPPPAATTTTATTTTTTTTTEEPPTAVKTRRTTTTTESSLPDPDIEECRRFGKKVKKEIAAINSELEKEKDEIESDDERIADEIWERIVRNWDKLF